MWENKYTDYVRDNPIKKERRKKRSHGCEMQEINGWGMTLHQKKRKMSSILSMLLSLFFSFGEEK